MVDSQGQRWKEQKKNKQTITQSTIAIGCGCCAILRRIERRVSTDENKPDRKVILSYRRSGR